MDPFKFPPRCQSLLALGMSLAGACSLAGGVKGKVEGQEDGRVWLLLEAAHHTPQGGETLLGGD